MGEGTKGRVVVESFTGDQNIAPHVREISEDDGGISLRLEEMGLWETVSSFARKIIAKMWSGSLDFSSLQRPAAFTQPVSHLATIVNDHLLTIKHVQAMNGISDPRERLKLLTAGVIGNLCYSVFVSKGKGPVASCLGETFQGTLLDGCAVYGEQICVAPHTSQLLFLGPNGAYEISARVRVSLKVRSEDRQAPPSR